MGQLGQEEAGSLPTPGADEGFVATFNDGGGVSNFTAEDLKDGDKVALTLHERKRTTSGQFKNKDGTPKAQILWTFTVDGFDEEEYGTLRYYTGFSMHEKGKLGPALDAMGIERPTEEKPTIGGEPGIKCFGIIKHVKKKKQDGTDVVYPRIDRLVAR